MLKLSPIMPDHILSRKYIVPMSLWLVENIHRIVNSFVKLQI